MNFNDLQNAWNSGGNEPTAVQRERLAKQFAASVRRQRRNQLIWLIWTFFVLTVMTGFASWIVFATGKMDIAREWGIIPLLLIPWGAAILFLKRFLKPVTPLYRGDVTITDALTAAAAAKPRGAIAIENSGGDVCRLYSGPRLWHVAALFSRQNVVARIVFHGALLCDGARCLRGGSFCAIPLSIASAAKTFGIAPETILARQSISYAP